MQETGGYYCEVALSAGKCGSSGTEINALVDIEVGFGVDIVFLENIFKDHFGHAAGSAQHYEK